MEQTGQTVQLTQEVLEKTVLAVNHLLKEVAELREEIKTEREWRKEFQRYTENLFES